MADCIFVQYYQNCNGDNKIFLEGAMIAGLITKAVDAMDRLFPSSPELIKVLPLSNLSKIFEGINVNNSNIQFYYLSTY